MTNDKCQMTNVKCRMGETTSDEPQKLPSFPRDIFSEIHETPKGTEDTRSGLEKGGTFQTITIDRQSLTNPSPRHIVLDTVRGSIVCVYERLLSIL